MLGGVMNFTDLFGATLLGIMIVAFIAEIVLYY